MITYVASSTSDTGTAAKPTGTANGDHLIALVAAETSSVDEPAGWSQFAAGVVGTNPDDHHLILYYKMAGGSEPANYTWTPTVGAAARVGVAAYRLTISGAPATGAAGSCDASDTLVVPDTTAAVNSSALLLAAAEQLATTTASGPAGFTERFDAFGLQLWDKIPVGEGETDDETVTLSAADKALGFQFALTPDLSEGVSRNFCVGLENVIL